MGMSGDLETAIEEGSNNHQGRNSHFWQKAIILTVIIGMKRMANL
jgi:hypothetical protein